MIKPQAFCPNNIKADSLRAGFYIACFCSTSFLIPHANAEPIEPYASRKAAAPYLHIGVDPRIELLTTVQLLSQYRYLTPYRVDYARDILIHFSKYQHHQAMIHALVS